MVNMWTIVRKLKLIVPILLTSLLTSFFLLVQICLLESNCHDGLSQVMSTHREALNFIVGRRYSQSSTLQLPLDIVHDYDLNRSAIQGVVKNNGSGMVSNGVGDSEKVSEGVDVTKPLTQSHMNISTTSSSLQTQATPPKSITELSTHESTIQVIPKSAFYMLQFFRSHHCRLPHCMDYFSNFDKACLDYCVKKLREKEGKRNKHVTSDSGMYGDCRFMQGGERAAVALASLPGSGNTWIRGLLEKATGICTGEL